MHLIVFFFQTLSPVRPPDAVKSGRPVQEQRVGVRVSAVGLVGVCGPAQAGADAGPHRGQPQEAAAGLQHRQLLHKSHR